MQEKKYIGNKEKIRRMQQKISFMNRDMRILKRESKKKDKMIDGMAKTMIAIMTDIPLIKEQFQKEYCEFINSNEDCCWKSDTNCSECVKRYFEKTIEYIIIKIKIDLRDIVKLQRLYIQIFTEEDNESPNRRIIAPKERAVQRILDNITTNKFNQIEIWKVIQLKTWDRSDNTYRPICNRLRELGYEIINEEGKC